MHAATKTTFISIIILMSTARRLSLQLSNMVMQLVCWTQSGLMQKTLRLLEIGIGFVISCNCHSVTRLR
jgi:hypothetical protein